MPSKIKLTDSVDGETVSSLILYFVDLPSRKLAVIEEVWTKEEFRRQGRSRALMLQAIECAKKNGRDCVELTVRQDRPDIQGFYKSLGFFDRLNCAYRLKLD